MAAEMRLEEAHEMQVAAHAKVLWWPEEVLTAQLMSFGKWHLREVYWMFVICEVAWLNPWQTAVFAKKGVLQCAKSSSMLDFHIAIVQDVQQRILAKEAEARYLRDHLAANLPPPKASVAAKS
eukprot:1141038-Pelagomonas_calceolata.AAC.7